ncbi:MAG TPA: pilus assembly PilX N-terminal domain-containing protein, partial [Polyangia bacterium]
MRNNKSPTRPSLRRQEAGAVLVVVLLAMIALLGMGITGLYLTSGSIQMSSNINMRNQALYVAEAGIQTAKSVLNRTLPGNAAWKPWIGDMLAGRSPTQAVVPLPSGLVDEIPTSPDGCLGIDVNGNPTRGAYLRDDAPSPPYGCDGSLVYVNCSYPNNPSVAYDQTTNDPNNPPPPTQFMGRYTLFIRQDLAECRMGQYSAEVDGVSNGVVVIRSEGVASDNRTRVALEVTMTTNPNAVPVAVRVASVCPAGAAGCDDNASVQQGITVAGSLTPPPPGGGSMGGSSGGGGAGGAGGTSGAAGAGGAGGESTTPVVAGSNGGGGANGGGAGAGGGGAGGNGAGGAGGSAPGCVYDQCNVIATIGIYGPWNPNCGTNPKSPNASYIGDWLAKHSDSCHVTNFDLEDPKNPITA